MRCVRGRLLRYGMQALHCGTAWALAHQALAAGYFFFQP